MLDECEARVIVLLAPAGYGKTTLARQWAKTLNGAIWVTLTPAHRDVARLAEDLAAGVDRLGGDASQFISRYLRARSNPQRAARDIGSALANEMSSARAQWLVVDDYHEIGDSVEVADLISALQEQSTARFLISSRARPSWATRRRSLYGDIDEVSREDLAMDEREATLVLGRRPDLRELVTQAEGWPAVLGLAASTSGLRPPGGAMPDELYNYIAEELYQSIPEAMRTQLLHLALVPELTQDAASEQIGPEAQEVIDHAREVGFLSTDQVAELHPLIREFLLQKLSENSDAQDVARKAVWISAERGRWDRSFELILRFDLTDMIEPVLEIAYKPLVRSGHLETLATFAANVRSRHRVHPVVIDLIDADVALRDGNYSLAVGLADRVRARLASAHPLASRANAVVGQGSFLRADLATAETAYRSAQVAARDDQDEAEALYGWALASIQGEGEDPTSVLEKLALRRQASALDLVRYGTVELARRRFGVGFAAPLGLEETLHALPRVEDPRARSSLTFSLTYARALMGEYREAFELAEQAQVDIEAFDLEFARPHSNWNLAFVSLGLRRFGAAEQFLQLLEDASRQPQVDYHVLNARILRARLALQTGELDRALELVQIPATEITLPSLQGEYLATRAMAFAVAGDQRRSVAAATEATGRSKAIEVKVLATAARAISSSPATRGRDCSALFELARSLGIWDPVVTALRCSPVLSELAASMAETRPDLERLYERSNDLALARRAGIRTRSARSPEDILSPRELEVLGLLARGFRNREVANGLVISESTTKVHVRHILEKLGVRTRAEAVARFNLFEA
ncbi:MAG TPA: LuxR C-terminal-related transcriptional regulator [Gaiellaceae bacterium]|nr:LuxR C-terminal-related transcriptional regulator [Gaiellaceae bacterium]